MNMLRAMVYVPAIRAPALAAIVDRLVDVDVSSYIVYVDSPYNNFDCDSLLLGGN